MRRIKKEDSSEQRWYIMYGSWKMKVRNVNNKKRQERKEAPFFGAVSQSEEDERKKIQVLDDAPGNAEEAPWDVVKGPQGSEELLKEEMEVEGRVCPERVILEEVEIKKIPAGPVHDPPRFRLGKKTAPVQLGGGEPVIF